MTPGGEGLRGVEGDRLDPQAVDDGEPPRRRSRRARPACRRARASLPRSSALRPARSRRARRRARPRAGRAPPSYRARRSLALGFGAPLVDELVDRGAGAAVEGTGPGRAPVRSRPGRYDPAARRSTTRAITVLEPSSRHRAPHLDRDRPAVRRWQRSGAPIRVRRAACTAARVVAKGSTHGRPVLISGITDRVIAGSPLLH